MWRLQLPVFKFFLLYISLTSISLTSVFFAEVSSATQAPDPTCQASLGPFQSLLHREEFSGFVTNRSGLELFVKIERPRFFRPKEWILLMHGLLDNEQSFDALVKECLDRGYGVVRFDQRGFGQSLEKEVQATAGGVSRFRPPYSISYLEYVSDLEDLLHWLSVNSGIKQPRLVSHSLGGAVQLAALANKAIRPLVSPKSLPLAPYVYRLDYHLFERIVYGGFSVGGHNPLVTMDSFIPGLFRAAPEYFLDLFVSDPQMRHTFSKFLLELEASQNLPDEDPQMRRHRINYAIAAVKGLRDFNALKVISNLPDDYIPDLVLASQDELIDKALARKIKRSVEARGGRVHHIDHGHLFLQDAAEKIGEILDQQ